MMMSRSRMQALAKRATDACSSTTDLAKRVAEELGKLPVSGIPLEVDDEDSLVVAVEQAKAAATSTEEAVAVARTRSQEIVDESPAPK